MGKCGGCSIGVCLGITDCGGPGERACCFLENTSIGACESGLIENGDCDATIGATNCFCGGASLVKSDGVCVEPDCGGDGERGCCLLERIPSCESGKIEDLSPGCVAELGADKCDCGFGSGQSLGVCREKKAVGDTGCDNITDPCQSGAFCMSTGIGETVCVPAQNDGLFGDDVCAAFYNPTAHAIVMEGGFTSTFGLSGALSFSITGSVEAGVAYAADGCYGCYYTKCFGFETDVSASAAACIGIIFDGKWPSVAGDTCAFTVSGSFPGTKLGASQSVIVGGSSLDICNFDDPPVATATCFSVGVGLNPLPVGGSAVACNTVTNLVACIVESASGDGDLFLTPDETPICLANETYVACPDSTIQLNAIAIDPDGDSLSYSWTTDCPGDSFSSTSAAMPTLTLNPAPSCSFLDCTVTLTADGSVADDSGSISPVQVVCTASVVGDEGAPEFTDFPSDVTIDCTLLNDATATNANDAAAMDLCDSNPTIMSSDSLGDCVAGERVVTRTWTTTDTCNNSRNADQMITLTDSAAPSIDVAAQNQTGECDGTGNTTAFNAWLASDGVASASDNCGNVSWSNNHSSLSDGCGGTGAETVTFTATDECGLTATTSATFTIEDTADPSITCPGTVYHEAPVGVCTDAVSYSVTASDACGTTTIACVPNNTGASGVTATGGNFPVGTTNVTCTATDECGLTDECSFDVVVNDPPSIVSVVPSTQQVQYSDKIVPVVVTATDCGPGSSFTLEFDSADVPSDLALSSTADSCGINASDLIECTWTLDNDIQVLEPEGDYVIDAIKAVDPTTLNGVTLKSAPDESITVNVKAENATIAFDSGNPVAVQVVTDGGNSGMFDLIVDVQELNPELVTVGGNLPGDIGLAVMSMTLAPVGPGGGAVGTCTPDNDPNPLDYNGVLTVTCSFDDVGVNTYTVEAVLVANASGELFYTGSNEDVLVIFDPSLGFTGGGGHFAWPGTGDRTNWGYTMKYNKRRTNIQGSLLLIRHLSDGTNYRIKSNALYGLAVGNEIDFGWASFAGKCNYRDPSMVDPIGNHEFITYVEDHGELGAGGDKFWLQTLDRDGAIIIDLSMDEAATSNAETIVGGDIVVPH